jgi:hypothetical protein
LTELVNICNYMLTNVEVTSVKKSGKRARAKKPTRRPKTSGTLPVATLDLGSGGQSPLTQLPAVEEQSSWRRPGRPFLIVRYDDLTLTARSLGKLFADSGFIFDRAGPVKLIQTEAMTASAYPLTAPRVAMEAHAISLPVRLHIIEEQIVPEPVTLPPRVAVLYLAQRGEFGLRRLEGICTTPLLSETGEIRTAEGYDPSTRLWCTGARIPPIARHPTKSDADNALSTLRKFFMTFSFADSPKQQQSGSDLDVVDIAQPPGLDESTFLVGLLTAVCRPSIPLAPGILIRAPQGSGTGEGKGLLVEALGRIAFDVEPCSFTKGGSTQNLDKSLAAALIQSRPILSIDNVNSTLQSDLLAQCLSEEFIETRLLGRTEMRGIKSTALVTVTGNGTLLAEDLVRRFIACHLDSQLEEAYLRRFEPGFGKKLIHQRGELLAAVLTIWRWGRQNFTCLDKGIALGSYEQWAAWCRDPMLSLGCQDPVRRISEFRRDDPVRTEIAALFLLWHERHGQMPITLAKLNPDVRALLNPHNKGTNWVTSRLTSLHAARVGGFVFERVDKLAQYGFHSYRVRKIADG